MKECGICINNGKDQLMAQASNFPLEVLYLRNSDIPHYVEDGIVDVAIIGENTVIEKRANVLKLLDLGFSGCRVSIRRIYWVGLVAGKADCDFLS